MKPKEDLLRVVKLPQGIVLDNTFKAQGRGAYICKESECIKMARKRRAFERSLSCGVDAGLYDYLEAMITDAE